MDILAEEGVKFLYTEMFVHPDHTANYQGLNYVDTQKQLKLLDFKSALCTKYPDMDYEQLKELSIRWFDQRQDIPPAQLAELDALYASMSQHKYNAEKLYACAQKHGITVVGANISGADRYSAMLGEAKKFFSTHADEGKIIFHAGSRHIGSGGGTTKGMSEELNIPSVSVCDGPQATSSIFAGAAVQWNIPNEKPICHDHIIQGSQTDIPGVIVNYPKDYSPAFDVVLADGKTRIGSSNYDSRELRAALTVKPSSGIKNERLAPAPSHSRSTDL